MGRVRWIDLRQLLQAAHTLWQLRSQQMPLAGMHTQYLAVGGDLESLPSAAMRFQFTFLLLFRHRLSFTSGLTHAVADGRAGAPPFLGARRAINMLASMRGPISTSA